MNPVRQLWTCHWSGRRLQRYLDADPSATLSSEEVRRLEAHLDECERCAKVLAQHRRLRRLLSGLTRGPEVDPAAVARVRTYLDHLTEEPRP